MFNSVACSLKTLLLFFLINGARSLVYPFYPNEAIPSGMALVPCGPRPMYAYKDSPFRLFGAKMPYIEVELEVEVGSTPEERQRTMETLNKLFLVRFGSQTDSVDGSLFLEAYRFIPTVDLSQNLCNADANLEDVLAEIVFVEKDKAYGLTRTPFRLKEISGQGVVTATTRVGVEKTGYEYAFLINCAEEPESPLVVSRGAFAFENPHGLLPGGWFVKLPFSVMVGLGYFLFLFVYGVRLGLFRKDGLYIQFGVVIVLFIGLIEQITYFLTFHWMNTSGGLPCCPVNPRIALSMILGAVKRSVLVIFLLAVSLGYGIQRPRITNKERLGVFAVGFLYLFAATSYEVAGIQKVNALTSGEDDPSPAVFGEFETSLLLSLLNIIAISWIYISMSKVIQDLREKNERAKRKMYERLSKALVLWFVVGFLVDVMFYTLISESVTLSWEYEMLPKFIADVLFLALVVQIGILWFPSSVTSKYAYSTQLPTMDFDELEGINASDSEEEGGMEIPRPKVRFEKQTGFGDASSEEDDFAGFETDEEEDDRQKSLKNT